jgi:DNA-binding transcriptional regulator YdaS (Cro superfamily)
MPAPRTDHELFSHLGPRLEALLHLYRTPLSVIADLLGCKESFVSHLLDGRRLLPADKLPILASFLKVTPEQLLGLEEIKKTRTLKLPKLKKLNHYSPPGLKKFNNLFSPNV